VVDVEPYAHRRTQRSAGEADLDPAGAEVRIVPGRAAQQALAQAQFAVVHSSTRAWSVRKAQLATISRLRILEIYC